MLPGFANCQLWLWLFLFLFLFRHQLSTPSLGRLALSLFLGFLLGLSLGCPAHTWRSAMGSRIAATFLCLLLGDHNSTSDQVTPADDSIRRDDQSRDEKLFLALTAAGVAVSWLRPTLHSRCCRSPPSLGRHPALRTSAFPESGLSIAPNISKMRAR